jgi:transposase
MFDQITKYHKIENYEYLQRQPKAIIHPRLAWMLYYKEVHSVRKVCERFKISRKTFYKWWQRYNNSGEKVESLFDISKKPHHSPSATPNKIVQRVIDAKLMTGYGQRRLREYLIKHYKINLSEHTIWKLIKQNIPSKNNYNGLDAIDEKLPDKLEPGDHIQLATMDVTKYVKNIKSILYTAIDIATNLRISKIYDSMTNENTAHFINLIIEKYPFKIKSFTTPYSEAFTRQLKDDETGYPRDSVTIITINQNNIRQQYFTEDSFEESIISKMMYYDEANFFKAKDLHSIDEANIQLKHYLNQINNHVTFNSIDNFTPLQKIRQSVNFKKIYYFDPLD